MKVNLKRQRGAALIIALVMTALIVLVSTVSLKSSQFEIKVSKSIKSDLDSLAIAEDVLKKAEQSLLELDNLNCAIEPRLFCAGELKLSQLVDYFEAMTPVDEAGRSGYLIEYLDQHSEFGQQLFRISALGSSEQGGIRIIQSHFLRADS